MTSICSFSFKGWTGTFTKSSLTFLQSLLKLQIGDGDHAQARNELHCGLLDHTLLPAVILYRCNSQGKCRGRTKYRKGGETVEERNNTCL